MHSKSTEAAAAYRGVDLVRWSPPVFAVLLLLAVPAFWGSYLKNPLELGSFTTHLHAVTASGWFALLLAQPILLRAGYRRAHRGLGYLSLLVAPLVLVGFIVGAHGMIGRWPPDAWGLAKYILYLQLSLAVAFGLFWLLRMLYRRDRKVHARFMVATGLTFGDPVLARLIPVLPGAWSQIVTFTLVEAILVWLIWRERGMQQGRWAFPAVLAVFLFVEIPMVFSFSESHTGLGTDISDTLE